MPASTFDSSNNTEWWIPCPNGTVDPQPNSTSVPLWAGYVAAPVAILMYGSNFVPVKQFRCGDGLFFQWIMCSAVMMCGIAVNCFRNFPPFHPLVMLGGFLWTTGNILCVPIINMIGLGLGILVWASLTLLVGWVSGRFGLFGICPEVPHDTMLNYIGTALSLCGGVAAVFVRPTPNSHAGNTGTVSSFEQIVDEIDDTGNENRVSSGVASSSVVNSEDQDRQILVGNDSQPNVNQHEPSFIDNYLNKLPYSTQRILGCGLAMIAGLFFGLIFTPTIYVQNHYKGASQNGLDYVFAQFTAIYATSTVYFLLYCAVCRNRPTIYPELVLPAFVSGAMWAIATTSWFVANATLSEAVSFPIITQCPPLVASLWGVLLYREITGRRNLFTLFCAFVLCITGATLAGLSKIPTI